MNVLITGAFGSLGQGFIRYFLDKGDTVTGVDNNEWSVAAYPNSNDRLTKRLGDFAYVHGKFDLLVHCAAYKHVDLIEHNQQEALYNNYVKTAQLYQNVEAPILFISTDKAVEPASFYGTTKKLGEDLTKIQGGVIARSGNFMRSSGSVIPKWEAAIEKGEPLPITDPQMTRYMIDVDKAVEKIMTLYPLAEPGDVIVPDMGEPINLMDIVEKVLIKHGQEPEYPMEVIGIRPGEKLHEKLTWDDEKTIISNLSGIIVRR